jgi:ubiquinone/menaquinone biosynthesis C-methylase UbiE
MPRPADFDRLAASYDRGRALSPEAAGAWRAALARWVPLEAGRPLLDLGAGTGGLSRALAEWFGVPVIGVEPADGMRRAARAANADPRVAVVGGEAERIPLRDGTCGGAWLSNVIAHVPDLRACARELRRVVRSGGRVLVRDAFAGRLEGITLFHFFPSGRRIVEETGVTLDALVDAFRPAGFTLESLTTVRQPTAPDLATYADRVRTRADSVLQLLSDEDFARGLDAIDAAAAASAAAPVVDALDLVALR